MACKPAGRGKWRAGPSLASYACVSTCIAVVSAAGESSWVAAMATTSSVLHQAFEYFHWTVRSIGVQAARQHNYYCFLKLVYQRIPYARPALDV
jgi:mannose/fructose/N-acetylgalactosamine-specific phosphotransferase system component IIC